MTAYTQPDGLPVSDPTDSLVPLDEHLEDIAVATQAALLRPGAVGSAAVRDLYVPSPMTGQSVWRTDLGWREVYLAAPVVGVSGWYPLEGIMPTARYGLTSLYNSATATSGATDITWQAQTMLSGPASVFSQSGTTVNVNQAGMYSVTFGIQFDARADNSRRNARLLQNGVQIGDGSAVSGTGTVGAITVGGTLPVKIAAGDGFRLQYGQSSAGSINIALPSTMLAFRYLGPA